MSWILKTKMDFGSLNPSTKITLEPKEGNFKDIIGETTSFFKTPSAPKTLIIRPK
jgi:hypothetical protein